MKILLLTGIAEEYEGPVSHYRLPYNRNRGFYLSNDGCLAITSTGPGVRKKTRLMRKIRDFDPDLILLAGLSGFIGTNENSVRVGEGYFANRIVSRTKEYDASFSEQKNQCGLFSVDYPLFEKKERNELFLTFGTELIDMESAPFVELLFSGENPVPPLVVYRVVGDLSSHSRLFQYEQEYRAVRQSGFLPVLSYLVKNPLQIFDRWRLMRVRKKGLNGLARGLVSILDFLLSQEGNGNLDQFPLFLSSPSTGLDDNR